MLTGAHNNIKKGLCTTGAGSGEVTGEFFLFCPNLQRYLLDGVYAVEAKQGVRYARGLRHSAIKVPG